MKVITFDQVDRFLSNLWDMFPLVISNPKSTDPNDLVQPMKNWSKEFCQVGIPTSSQLVGKGGAGNVFDLKINKDRVLASGLSFNWEGYWLVYWTDVVVKVGHRRQAIKMQLEKEDTYFRIVSNNYLHEAIVYGLVGHLSNVEIGLALPRNFGMFMCNSKIYTITEKYDMTLFDAIRTKVVKPDDLPIIILHFAVQFWAMKEYMGIEHFDMHSDNIMIQVFKSDEQRRTIIHGEVASEITSFEYIFPWGDKIIVPNIGLMPKIIDWGMCRVDLRESHGQPFVFENNSTFNDKSYFLNEAMASTTNGDMEYNYMVANILEEIEENYLPASYKRVLIPLMKATLTKKTYSHLTSTKWTRDVGTTTDRTRPVKKLCRYLGEGDETDNILTVDFTKTKRGREMFQNFIQASDKLTTDCAVIKKGNKKKCAEYEDQRTEWDANAVLATSFVKNSITTQTQNVWITPGKNFKSTIRRHDLAQFLQLDHVRTQTYLVNYQPSHYPQLVLPNKERLNFLPTHRMSDFEAPPEFLIGKPLPDVNLRITYLPNQAKVTCAIDESLWDSSDRYKNSVSINGQFFIVNYNIKNPLTNWLKADDDGIPIGFYYDRKSGQGGTVLPTQPPYDLDFGVVTVYKNKLTIYRKPDFYDLHQLTTQPILVYCCNKSQNKVDKKVACFSMPVIELDRNKQPITSLKYDIAFESGPILIWEGKIVFTREKMMNDMFDMKALADRLALGEPDDIPTGHELVTDVSNYPYYQVQPEEKDCHAYLNKAGEVRFYSDQRHSNSFTPCHALCLTWDDEWISVIGEGRGYTSVGLDRPQFTSLLSTLNVRHAIGLDGGFSASVLHNLDGVKTYVLHDPDKRPVGMNLTWSWK